ncbi:MAG: leucyl aminopeptidase family protein, partial [Pseudomonadota bacterium]
GAEGALTGGLFGLGKAGSGDPCGPNTLNLGRAPSLLPAGDWRLQDDGDDPTLAAIAWGLGAYRFEKYRNGDRSRPRLLMPDGADADRVRATVAAVHAGRDMINTPANDLGPQEIADAVAGLARVHGAEVVVHRGEDGAFADAFPLLSAVGRASTRPPRLVDLTWGDSTAPKITLVGKGIAFDTGGLDIKPAAAMLLMKKDMGGAAAAFAAAHMIMARKMPVHLRLIIATAENAVAGDAFRPGDVITSRKGLSVEIGNTDAEGRLVLADALALADEGGPDLMMTFATLTGAARVALGTDLPAFFSTDDSWAGRVETAGLEIGDPVWRMPLWPGYDQLLESDVADLNNISSGPFGGAITAAMFLKRFVDKAKVYAHADLYGWRPTRRSLGPKGGEVQSARAVADAIEAFARAA